MAAQYIKCCYMMPKHLPISFNMVPTKIIFACKVLQKCVNIKYGLVLHKVIPCEKFEPVHYIYILYEITRRVESSSVAKNA